MSLVASANALFQADQVQRTTTGEWIEQFYNTKDPNARGMIDGVKGFRPLAAMMLYMDGFGRNGANPEDKNNFERR